LLEQGDDGWICFSCKFLENEFRHCGFLLCPSPQHRGQVTPLNVGAKQWAGSEEALPAGQRRKTPVGWTAYGVTPKAGLSNFTPLRTA
jgi:hypothetical protein